MQQSVYFANEVGERLASAVYDKVALYRKEIERNGRLSLWTKSYRAYYALSPYDRHEAASVRRGGEQQELHLLKANHYRNLLTHLHVLTTQQRAAFECRAVNTDYKSQLQTILGVNILEYYLREKRLEEHYRRAAEFCIVYGESFVTLDWDKTKGDVAAVDFYADEAPIPTGDIVGRVFNPLQVARPCRVDSDTESDWYTITLYVNRHNLAAEFPEYATEIMSFSGEADETDIYGYGHFGDDDDDDTIPIQMFYHDRTAACPSGRVAKCLGSALVLSETTLDALKYKKLPVYRMAAYNQDGTSFGYTVAFDLLCVQEAIDILYSTILSNQATFGVQNVWMPPGSTLYPSQLAGGLNVFESEEKPESINLTNTPPEIFKFLQGLETLGEVLSGVNSVARGQPEASLKSGSALALVASQAVQFSDGISAAYTRLQEDVSTGVIYMLQTKATVPRIAAIAGKHNRSYVKEFVGDDISSINRVVVERANPVSRTVAGRIQMAQDLLQAQTITPQEYIQVMTTGKLETVIENEQAQELLIRYENEDLREGRPVIVTAIDLHVMHIKGHAAVFADPEARRNPAIIGPALAHVQEHIDALRFTDAALLNVLGQAPISSNAPPQGENAPQTLPNQQPQLPGPGEPVPAPENASPEVQANMPSMPTNPNAPEIPPQ